MQTRQFMQFLKSAMPIAALSWAAVAAGACSSDSSAGALNSESNETVLKSSALLKYVREQSECPGVVYFPGKDPSAVIYLGNQSYVVMTVPSGLAILDHTPQILTMDKNLDGVVDLASIGSPLNARNVDLKSKEGESIQKRHEKNVRTAYDALSCHDA